LQRRMSAVAADVVESFVMATSSAFRIEEPQKVLFPPDALSEGGTAASARYRRPLPGGICAARRVYGPRWR